MTRLDDLPADVLISIANRLPNKCALKFECSYDLVNILRGPGRTLCEAVDYKEAKSPILYPINRFNPLRVQLSSRYSITALVLPYDECDLTDGDFDAIAKLPLKSLEGTDQLTGTEVEIRGLAKLPKTLEELDVGFICADDLRFTPSLCNLRKLSVGSIDDPATIQRLSLCVKLEELYIQAGLGLNGLNALASSCPQLKVISLHGLNLSETYGMQGDPNAVHNHASLLHLHIYYLDDPTVEDVRRILQGIPDLRVLQIRVQEPSTYAELANWSKLVVTGPPVETAYGHILPPIQGTPQPEIPAECTVC